MSKHIYRLIILNKNNALVTEFNGIQVLAGMNGGFKCAKRRIRGEIQAIRSGLREDSISFKKHGKYSYELIGGVFTASGSILDLYRSKKREIVDKKLRVLKSEKTPFNGSLHVGVEIEFFSTKDYKRKDIEAALVEADLEDYCNLTTDSSVRGDGDNDDNCDGGCREDCECAYCGDQHYCENAGEHARRNRTQGDDSSWTEDNEAEGKCDGHRCMGYDDHEDFDCNCECDCNSLEGLELRVIAPQDEIHTIIIKACEVLKKMDASVNKSCGLHVHLDMRSRPVIRAYKNLVLMQDLFYRMMPSTRIKNTYCKPTPNENWDQKPDNRYHGINPCAYREHRTLEVRIHSGSVSAMKINHWISILIATVSSRKIKAKPRTPNAALRLINISDKTMKHAKARLELFKSEHVAA